MKYLKYLKLFALLALLILVLSACGEASETEPPVQPPSSDTSTGFILEGKEWITPGWEEWDGSPKTILPHGDRIEITMDNQVVTVATDEESYSLVVEEGKLMPILAKVRLTEDSEWQVYGPAFIYFERGQTFLNLHHAGNNSSLAGCPALPSVIHWY